MPRTNSPATLAPGDLVGVVATGFAVRRDRLASGVAALRRMGFKVRLGTNVLERHGYLAGDDAARADDLTEMLEDPAVRAVWFARGGYGTARILDRVPWHKLGERPRLLIGYSDLTALFAAAAERRGTRCLYGPVVTDLANPESYHRPSLRRLLKGEEIVSRLRRRDVLVPGKATGRLVGGNLSVLCHLLGTRFAPKFAGGVLFLEEIGEQAYRIDAALTQLHHAGAFEKLRGVILGDFAVPARRRFPPDRPWVEVVTEAFAAHGIPVVSGLPAGHVAGKWTLPLGGVAELDTDAGRVRFRP